MGQSVRLPPTSSLAWAIVFPWPTSVTRCILCQEVHVAVTETTSSLLSQSTWSVFLTTLRWRTWWGIICFTDVVMCLPEKYVYNSILPLLQSWYVVCKSTVTLLHPLHELWRQEFLWSKQNLSAWWSGCRLRYWCHVPHRKSDARYTKDS